MHILTRQVTKKVPAPLTMERNTNAALMGWLAFTLLLFLSGQINKSFASPNRMEIALSSLDRELVQIIHSQEITAIHTEKTQTEEQIALGKALFFDKILSGSRDIACATCHHPALNSGDDLSLSIGVGGNGLGYKRILGKTRRLIPRNAPEIFNRGAPQWQTMFWDGRVEITSDGHRVSPADEKLPVATLENIVAIQAMFPVTSRQEMRGRKADLDIDGHANTLAALGDTDFEEIWRQIMARVLAIPEYVVLFNEAYPDVPTDDLHFAHAANALSAFQTHSFAFEDSPWDRYIRGQHSALSTTTKEGAILFYGRAGCSSCHSGTLMSDQRFYNLLVPQIGPGHRDSSGFDIGRARVTDKKKDAFAFRTPPLRNVAITGPWMHNGAYTSLKAVIIHHSKPLEMLQTYNISQLDPNLEKSFRLNTSTILVMSQTFSPEVNVVPELSEREIEQLITFLEALTSPSTADLSYLVPQTVPSGLSVDR